MDRNEILHGGWPSDGSSKVRISSKKIGFGAVGVGICPSPLTWPLAYTTACTTLQAVTISRIPEGYKTIRLPCRLFQLSTGRFTDGINLKTLRSTQLN